MKEEYVSPEFEVVYFGTEDVITLSDGDDYENGSEYSGGLFG